jgi:branched-chain amino acid transport system substrate-binding protein
MINDKAGIGGRRIELIVKDDGYDPDRAVWNTHDLITKDRVFLLFGYVGTPTLTRVLPLLRYYEAEHIVTISPYTGAEAHRQPPHDKYVFNIRTSFRYEVQQLVTYFYRRGFRKIGFFGSSDAYGKSGESSTVAALNGHGLNLVGSVAYIRGATFDADMRAQVRILRNKGVDAVVLTCLYAACAAFIRDARLEGWNVPVAIVNAHETVEVLRAYSKKIDKDLIDGLINANVVPAPTDTHYPLVRRYLRQIPAEGASFVSLEGFLNAAVITEALKRAGPRATRPEFIKAMESLSGWDPGINAKLHFSSTSHQGLNRVWLGRMEQGQLQMLDSPEQR